MPRGITLHLVQDRVDPEHYDEWAGGPRGHVMSMER
jgi:hypothetical protein